MCSLFLYLVDIYVFVVRGLGIIGEGAVLFAATGIASVGFLSQPGQHFGLLAIGLFIILETPRYEILIGLYWS